MARLATFCLAVGLAFLAVNVFFFAATGQPRRAAGGALKAPVGGKVTRELKAGETPPATRHEEGGGEGREEDVEDDDGRYRRAKMDAYLAQRTAQCDKGAGGWQSVDMTQRGIFNTYLYGDRTVKPESGYPDLEMYVGMQACETFDEGAGEESGWQIYRFGPMVGVGGSDWHQVWLTPLPTPQGAKFITGKMAAPVDERGAILGHPPIYSHHVHIEYDGVMHALEAHGDTTCSQEKGGDACYLRSYPEGYGLPFDAEGKGDFLSLNFMLNDLREFPAPPMVFYQEVALKWSAREDVKPLSLQVSHMSPGYHHPFSTTLVTKRPSFLWSTSKWLVDGKVLVSRKDQFPWFHAHRKFCGAAWVFAATPEELGLTTDLLQVVDDNSHPDQPTGETDLVWNPPESEDPIASLLRRVGESEAGLASLRCWLAGSEEEKVLEHVNATDASSAYPEAWRQNWIEGWYDRAGELHCDEWSFQRGESYTVVTLNGLDDRVPDLDLYTQHGAFLVAYESTEAALGPVTTEIYAPLSTQGTYDYSLAYNWKPSDFAERNETARREVQRRQRLSEVQYYLLNDMEMGEVAVSQRDTEALARRYRKKVHTLWDDAEAAAMAA